MCGELESIKRNLICQRTIFQYTVVGENIGFAGLGESKGIGVL